MAKLILTHEVTGLGAPGDVVEVKDGYARNYLVPRGLATAWTRGAVKQSEAIRKARKSREISTLDGAMAVRERLQGSPVVIRAGLGANHDRGALQALAHCHGPVQRGDLTGLARLADRLDLLDGTPGPGGRQAAGHQVVARIAVLDLDHVAGGTESGDLVREDELCHRPSSLSEPSSSTAEVPSRGRSSRPGRWRAAPGWSRRSPDGHGSCRGRR